MNEIVKDIAVICHYHFRRTFCYDFVNTDTCVKKYGNILLFIYYMGIWFSTEIYRLTLVFKH